MIDPKKVFQDKHIHKRALDILVPFTELLQSAKFENDSILVPLSGYRDPEEQAALYRVGRTLPGSIITNSVPLQSYHNYGLAVDYALWNGKYGLGFCSPPQPELSPAWDWMETCCREFQDIIWGGDFKMKDRPHVELHFGLPVSQLK